MLLKSVPGSRRLSPASSPLRTVRDSFPSYSSSLPKAYPYGVTRWCAKYARQLYDNLWQPPTLIQGRRCTSWPKATVLCIPPHDGSPKIFVRGHLPGHYTLRPPDVSSVSGRIMYFPKEHQPVSTPLQNGLRFFLHVNPAPPTACLAVSPAQLPEREYEVPTFRINDPMSNLGTPYTPTVQ